MRSKCASSVSFITIILLAATITTFAADSGSLMFNKKGYVTCGSFYSPLEGTIEFWIKPASNQNNEWIISILKDKDNSMEFGFGATAAQFTIKRAGEYEYATCDREKIPVGQWSHIVCTFGNGKAVIFVNGTGNYKKSNPGKYTLEHLAGGELRLGVGAKNDEKYSGFLAEVRLSDNIRYAEDFTPPAFPLTSDQNTVALWRFIEEGETLADASGRNHPATISGAVEHSKDRPSTPATK